MYLLKDFFYLKTKLSLIILAIIISLIHPPFWFILFPGILLILTPYFDEDSLLKFIYIIALSFAYWIISFWLLYLPIWHYWIWSSIILSGILGIIIGLFLKENAKERKANIELMPLFVFLIFGSLRFIPFLINYAPCGSDMSMHTYNTLLILLKKGVPLNYHPIFEMEGFGAQGAGFSILSAIFSTFSKLPPYRSTFFMTCLTHALVIGGFYSFLRTYFSSKTALFASITLTIFARDPQSYFQWGGNPTVLSFFFALVAYQLFLKELEYEDISWGRIFMLAILISAGFLTHFMPMSVFSLILLAFAINKIALATNKNLIIKTILTFFLVIFISLSYGMVFCKVHVSEGEWKTIFDWNNYLWMPQDFLTLLLIRKLSFLQVDISFLFPLIKILFSLSPPIFLFSVVGFFFSIKNRNLIKNMLIIVIILFSLLYFNLFFKNKMSVIFYPDRVLLFSLLPAAMMLGAIFDKVIRFKFYWLFFLIYILFIILGIRFGVDNKEDFFLIQTRDKSPVRAIRSELLLRNFYYYLFVQRNFSVTEKDLKAFEWIEKNCLEKGTFLINNDDAGIWIPAIIGRPAYFSHILLTLWDEYKSSFKKTDFKYLYIGARSVGPNIYFIKSFCDSKPEWLNKIYDNGAVIYQIKEPDSLIKKIPSYLHPAHSF